jgi:alkylated DNA repair dioxygenase AlkB
VTLDRRAGSSQATAQIEPQTAFVSPPAAPRVSVERFDVPDGELVLHRNAFDPQESAALFRALLAEIRWTQHMVTVYGRRLAAPRLSAWYGDPGAAYSYSGLRLQPVPWTEALRGIKERAEGRARTAFNSVLLNLYRDGRDSVGWHSDAEPELGRNPVIASVSFGATRRLVLAHKKRKIRVAVDLDAGSLLVMGGEMQHHWRHQLPKASGALGARINLSFRAVTLAPGPALESV